MCKVFIAVVLMAVAVYSAPHAPPTPEEMKAQLVAAGISEAAADGLVSLADKHKAEFEAAKGDQSAKKAAFEAVKAEADTYIKTQSAADQTAYAAFIEKKKADHEAHKAASH